MSQMADWGIWKIQNSPQTLNVKSHITHIMSPLSRQKRIEPALDFFFYKWYCGSKNMM